MFLRKLRTTAAVLLISALSGGAIVAVHRPTASAKAGSAATAPALVSSVKSGAASASSLNPDTRSESQILAGPVATVAEQSSQEGSGDCSAECPLAGGPPPWCPITMAMNAITNMMAQIHSWIGASS